MELTTVGPFLHYWDRFRDRTIRVARCVPDDHIEWRPRPGAFSFGDLLRHLAGAERYMFAENAARRPSLYPGHGRELADGKPAVLGYLDDRHRESMEIFGSLTDDDLQARCVTPGGAELRVWKWLRSMVEHEAHHRGQIYLMLGDLGVETPPLYGLTEEEVAARSRPS